KFAAATLAIALCSLPGVAEASNFRDAGSGTCLNLIDTDGDGIGDTRPERGTGVGANATHFVDADDNGVCDTYEAGGQQLLDGSAAPDDALQTMQSFRQRIGRNR
ncbi:MAG: hypothetical protein U9R29_10060, partial [Thermodesulfobacteriota bacterium]|nr:hypothetical protein [Thermodesulfobacteriota bacterium]